MEGSVGAVNLNDRNWASVIVGGAVTTGTVVRMQQEG